MSPPSYGIIGRGRLATHLTRYLELEGRSVALWHRGRPELPDVALSGSGSILLAISDGAIGDFVSANTWLSNHQVVHFSGSTTVAGAHGLHPLMTFGPDLYGHETYRSIPFVAERGGASFDEVFPGLPNPSWAIDPDDKPIYHALCVLAGNVTTLLWSKAMTDFETRLGLPARILEPYLRQTAANTLELGGASLTGPIARHDTTTIELDLAGLEGDPYRDVYLAVTRAAAEGRER